MTRLAPAPPRPHLGACVGWTEGELAVGGSYRREIEASSLAGPRSTVAMFMRVLRRCESSSCRGEDPIALMALLLEHGSGERTTRPSELLFRVGLASYVADRHAVMERVIAFLGGLHSYGGAIVPSIAARTDHLRYLLHRDAPRSALAYASRAESAYLQANERIPGEIAAALDAADSVARSGDAGQGAQGSGTPTGGAIATFTLDEVLELLRDADLDESEHKSKNLNCISLRRRVERARVNRRLGKPIQRSLDRMLVAAMQGATWAFNADMVRDWIALQRGAAEDKARITEEILELSSKRHRVG